MKLKKDEFMSEAQKRLLAVNELQTAIHSRAVQKPISELMAMQREFEKTIFEKDKPKEILGIQAAHKTIKVVLATFAKPIAEYNLYIEEFPLFSVDYQKAAISFDDFEIVFLSVSPEKKEAPANENITLFDNEQNAIEDE